MKGTDNDDGRTDRFSLANIVLDVSSLKSLKFLRAMDVKEQQIHFFKVGELYGLQKI